MCGRYTLRAPGKAFAAVLRRQVAELALARFNVAPGEILPVVVQTEEGIRQLRSFLWGLVPGWTRPGEKASPIVNARAETVQAKPAFRQPFRQRRCAVPADGFYEWRTEGGKKRPFFFRLKEDEPFAFAAIWEEWQQPDGGAIPSFCLLTTEANAVLAPVHHRMPVMLDQAGVDRWLGAAAAESEATLAPLLRPFPPERMEAVAVNPWVNRAGNEGPRCLEPWEGDEKEQLSLF